MSPRARIAVLLGYAALVLSRLPNVVLQGRFWAEEGNLFLFFAWSRPWWRALLSPWGGYLNLTANLAAVVAWHAVPLAAAPYVTTSFALAVQLCPAILLLTSRLEWLRRPPVLIAALLTLLAVPVCEEVWLNSISSQAHLALCSALILALEDAVGPVALFRLGLLALAALSGPGCWMLAPLFAARAALDRSRPRLLQAAVLSAGVLIQMLFFYTRHPDRAYAIHPLLFMELAFDKHVLLAFAGPDQAFPIAARMYYAAMAGHIMLLPVIGMAIIAVASIAALIGHWRSEAFWLLAAAAVLVGVSYIGALGNFAVMFLVGNGNRYTYGPQVLIGLALLAMAATRRGAVGIAGTIGAAWLLAIGAIYFYVPSSPIYAAGPSWRTELRLHRRNPAHIIAGWPPGWQVLLPDDIPAIR